MSECELPGAVALALRVGSCCPGIDMGTICTGMSIFFKQKLPLVAKNLNL